MKAKKERKILLEKLLFDKKKTGDKSISVDAKWVRTERSCSKRRCFNEGVEFDKKAVAVKDGSDA